MICRQRWQVQTAFSMVKRNPGSALTARRRHALDREIHLRLLTHNLMIIRRPLHTFQQSRPVPFSVCPVFRPSVFRPEAYLAHDPEGLQESHRQESST